MRLPPLYSPRTSTYSASSRFVEKTVSPHNAAANSSFHGGVSPRRSRAHDPEDAFTTPIDHAIDGIRDVTAKIKASFERMHQTEQAFDYESHALHVWIEQVQCEQEQITQAYLAMFQSSATHVQRVFRGVLARRMFRQALAQRAAVKIQWAFRAKQVRRVERRRQFRILSKKVLRGMKGIQARHDLTPTEIITRVGHNMMVERQWRMALGVTDTGSVLLHALYRRKFVQQRLAALFRTVVTMSGIVRFWRQLVLRQTNEDSDEAKLLDPDLEAFELTLQLDEHCNDADPCPEGDNASSDSATPLLVSLTQQLISPSSRPTKSSPKSNRLTRDDLRHKQKLYTQRLYEENLKKEAMRAVQMEKQREVARAVEGARKQQEDQQRQLRLTQALALREDMERRGLLATKEMQSKKEEELRKEEEAQKRIVQAKQRIAMDVLSDETQMLLARKQRRQTILSKPKE